MFGKTAEITIPTLVACADCHGSGARKGTSPVTCSDCGGYGQIRIQQGFFTVQQTCPTCYGKGQSHSTILVAVVMGEADVNKIKNYPLKFRQVWIRVIAFA